MMIKSLFAGAFFAGLLPLAAAGTVRNGSFEAFGGDGVPEFWKFTLSGGAPVAVAPATPGADGEKCVRIVSHQPQPQPNRFGLLSQMLALEPDTDYTLHFLARGAMWAGCSGPSARAGRSGTNSNRSKTNGANTPSISGFRLTAWRATAAAGCA